MEAWIDWHPSLHTNIQMAFQYLIRNKPRRHLYRLAPSSPHQVLSQHSYPCKLKASVPRYYHIISEHERNLKLASKDAIPHMDRGIRSPKELGSKHKNATFANDPRLFDGEKSSFLNAPKSSSLPLEHPSYWKGSFPCTRSGTDACSIVLSPMKNSIRTIHNKATLSPWNHSYMQGNWVNKLSSRGISMDSITSRVKISPDVVKKPIEGLKTSVSRYREAAGLQVEAFWKRNVMVLVGAVGVVSCFLLWQLMYGVANMFVSFSEGMAKFGFLAMAAATVSFTVSALFEPSACNLQIMK